MLPPFPPLPGWHVMVLHFPISLLMVASLFALVDIVHPGKAGQWGACALTLMMLGAMGAFVAVGTGELAAEYSMSQGEMTEETRNAIHDHRQLAQWARTVFTLLAFSYIFVLHGDRLIHKNLDGPVLYVIKSVFLICYFSAMILLVNAAHLGGTLVHVHGLQAPM